MVPQIYRAMEYINAEPILGVHVSCALLQVTVSIRPHLSLNLSHSSYTHFCVTFASKKCGVCRGF